MARHWDGADWEIGGIFGTKDAARSKVHQLREEGYRAQSEQIPDKWETSPDFFGHSKKWVVWKSTAASSVQPAPEVTIPKAVIRYKRNYGGGKSVNIVEYEHKGERLITGTVVRGTDKSLGWYFGKGTAGLKEANRIALLTDEEFSKAEDNPQHSWEKVKKTLAKPEATPAKSIKTRAERPSRIPFPINLVIQTPEEKLVEMRKEAEAAPRRRKQLADKAVRESRRLRAAGEPNGLARQYQQLAVDIRDMGMPKRHIGWRQCPHCGKWGRGWGAVCWHCGKKL